ncbi:MAG: acetyl-CoA carboxylase carboxyl transferase subunit alpha, partial [Lachnospiraceae bacterium]|nr:acetyl-CoA carboxylase carboxyl transferase subunit alpha [Lachnospiraceae bacterium]
DGIVPEPEGGAHEDPAKAVEMLEAALYPQFAALMKQSGSRLKESRYRKFREMGRP